MSKGLIAQATTSIEAPVATVWQALLDPNMIKQFMFSTEAVSDWREGSGIVWKGTWEGKPYEDKGVILKIEPEHLLQYTHFSPLSGQQDVPENYHTMTYELAAEGSGTKLSLSQDGNETEQEKEHSEKMWLSMLESIKKLLEQ